MEKDKDMNVKILGHTESIEFLRRHGRDWGQDHRILTEAEHHGLVDEEELLGVRTTELAFLAAADLLEVHDATGINLTQFGAVGKFVDHMLSRIGLPPVQDNFC